LVGAPIHGVRLGGNHCCKRHPTRHNPFGAAPHPVQWLADNGSAYAAHEMLDFSAALSLVPCFTPVRSPGSTGVREAFVKTLKRDYARVQPRLDSLTVLVQLPGWIEDHNESHPHSGLRMRSLREFIRSQAKGAQPCPT
jgi:putative transposase